MKRNDIFKLLEMNYDIKNEIKKINDLIEDNLFFCRCQKRTKEDPSERTLQDFNFISFMDCYLFDNYKYKGTCLDIDEFYKRCNAKLDFRKQDQLTEDRIINYLEVTENLIKLYFDNSDALLKKYNIKYYSDTYKKLRFLLDTLEKHLGIKIKEYKDKLILYVGNAKLEKALEVVEDQDIAMELVKYSKENLNYKEKRKLLKQLDILIEPIIDSIKQKYKGNKNAIYSMADDLSFIFNNFEIRHSNLDPSSNDFKPKLKNLKTKEFNEVYDIAYDLILDLLGIISYDTSCKLISNYKSKIV